MFLNWLKWCWYFKEILPWKIGLVDFDTHLSKEAYEYPETRINDIEKILPETVNLAYDQLQISI